MPQPGAQRQAAFTVPVTAGNYAPETIDIFAANGESAGGVLEVSVLVEALPATATAELQLLRVGGATGTPADWIVGKSYAAAGLQDLVALARWRGVRVKIKSGGTSGTGVVSVTYL